MNLNSILHVPSSIFYFVVALTVGLACSRGEASTCFDNQEPGVVATPYLEKPTSDVTPIKLPETGASPVGAEAETSLGRFFLSVQVQGHPIHWKSFSELMEYKRFSENELKLIQKIRGVNLHDAVVGLYEGTNRIMYRGTNWFEVSDGDRRGQIRYSKNISNEDLALVRRGLSFETPIEVVEIRLHLDNNQTLNSGNISGKSSNIRELEPSAFIATISNLRDQAVKLGRKSLGAEVVHIHPIDSVEVLNPEAEKLFYPGEPMLIYGPLSDGDYQLGAVIQSMLPDLAVTFTAIVGLNRADLTRQSYTPHRE